MNTQTFYSRYFICHPEDIDTAINNMMGAEVIVDSKRAIINGLHAWSILKTDPPCSDGCLPDITILVLFTVKIRQ